MKNMRNAARVVALLLVIVMVVLMGAGSQKSTPSTLHIRDAKELMELSEACKYDAYSKDLTVLLDNDIDLSDTEFVPIPTFGGIFNGQGHTISGMALSGDGAHMGLFRYIQAGGTVQDLTVSGTVDSAGTLTEIGAIVGTNMGTVTGCNFSGSISGKNNVGGIAGTNEASGMIYNCKSEGFVAGDHYVGGTVGQNLGTVSYCSNTAGVNVNTEDVSVETIDEISLPDENEEENKAANTSTDVGGIVGFSSGVVIGCTNWGTVGFQHVGYNIGGIVGRQSGLVTGCTNWGTALGRKDVGGVVGQMEPYIELDSGAGSIGKMEQDLNTLHDQMNVLLTHTGAATSEMSATLGSISAAAGRATEHARFVAESTMDYTEETAETVNELMVRINTSEKMVSPAITEFSQGSIQLQTATGYFANGFDELDAIDEMSEADKDSFKSSANDLTTSADKLNASMAYLGWLLKAADNSYGSGNYDLEAERPDTWEQDAEKYGYEYNPGALGNYESIRDALLRGAGDASGAAGAISGDVSTMTKVINTYYLTEDEEGQTRMDNMSEAFKSAFESLKQSTGHLSTGMSYLDQMASYLSGNETLELPTVSSDYRTEMEGMFDELGAISSGLSRLATQTANYSGLIVSDMRAVNDTFNVVMLDLCDILQLALDPDGKDIIEDVSEEDYDTITTGKVYSCQNYGTADGDVAVGGVVGTMAIEYDFDPESDSTILSETSLTSKYFTKCVLMDSTNYGTSVSRKDYSGGICGEADLGVIVGCQGYGTAESTLGSYVGGIAGMSKGSIRNSYAKCELTGENYVGGIAGFGKNISGCSTLMNLNADGNCVGTIAGELDSEGTIDQNYFVHETAAGVDGISYEGKAQALTYEEFMKRDGIPAEFSSFTATFTANGEVVKTIVFAYGASIDESEIPECPVVEGNYGRWPDFDYTNLTFDVEIRAEYTASASSVSGNLLSDDGTPVVILEGVFDPAAKAIVTESNIEGPSITGDRDLIAKYDVHVEDDSLAEGDDRAVKVRVYVPKNGSYNIYSYRDGRWDTESYTRDGSYLVFEQPNHDITFAVTRAKYSPLLFILLGLALCALLVCGLRALLKRRRRKAAEAETAANETVVDETNHIVTNVEETVPEAAEFAPEVELNTTEPEEITTEVEDVEIRAREIEVETPEIIEEAPVVEEAVPEVSVEEPKVEMEAPVIEKETVEVEHVAEAAAPVAAAAAGKGLFSFFHRRKNKNAAETEQITVPAVEVEAPAVDVELPTVEVEAPVVDAELPTVEVEAPVVDAELPTVEVEAPAVDVELPTVEVEAPAVDVELPTAEVEAPVVDAELPTVEVEAPAVDAELPTVEVEAPAVDAELPTAEVEAPVVDAELPTVEVEAPAVDVELPTVEVEAPAVDVELPTVEVEAPKFVAETEPIAAPATEQKHGLFGFLRRKSKKEKVVAAEPEAPVAVPVEAPVAVPVEPEVPEVAVADAAVAPVDDEISVEKASVEIAEPEAPVYRTVEEEVEAFGNASLDDMIADIRASIADLPEENAVVEEAPVVAEAPILEETPVVAEPVVEEAPVVAEAPVYDEVPLVAVPYVEAKPDVEEAPAVAEAPVFDEVPLVAVPYVEAKPDVEEAPAVTETPAFDEVPLVAVPYVEAKPEVEEAPVVAEAPAFDEVPLVAVPYVEETPAVDTSSLDALIANVRASVAEIPTEAPAAKIAAEAPVVDEVPLVAVPYVEETPAVDTSSLDALIANVRASVAEIPTEAPVAEIKTEEPVVEEVPVVEIVEEAPVVVEAPVEEPTSLDTFIASIRASVAEIPTEAPVVEVETEEPVVAEIPVVEIAEEAPVVVEAPVEEPTSLDTFIASIRASVAEIPTEAPVVEIKAEEPVVAEVPVVEIVEEAPVVVEAPVEEPTSLDTFIASIRASVAEIPTEEPEVETKVEAPVIEEAPAAEPVDSLSALIAQVRDTIADFTDETK